jgi:purine-binding chemotaxis protein CheW
VSNIAEGDATGLEELRSRLEASRAALERGFEPSEDEKQKILKTRAREFARETPAKAGAETWIEVVEFILAGERYGIEPAFIRDVFPLKTVTPVPFTPPFVVGITNIRGEVLSVIDLKRFFDLPDGGLTGLPKIIVLESKSMTFGILADTVNGTRSVPLDSIQPALPTLNDVRGKYLKGVTNDRMAILDGKSILCDETIVVNQQEK